MKKFVICSAVAMLAGCQAKVDDLQRYVAEIQETTDVSIEPYVEFKPMPAFKYEAQAFRNPFLRPKNKTLETTQIQQDKCAQPNTSRKKQALESYGLDALSISGTFTSQGRRWVLVTANDGSLHKATKGNYLGLFFGKITAIDQNGTVSISEMLPDGAGCWQTKTAQLSMSSPVGETTNV